MSGSWHALALRTSAALALASCAATATAQQMATLDAKELAAMFKEGGSCTWSAGDAKGEDFYYVSKSTSAGDADRVVGAKTEQGIWMVSEDRLCLTFGSEACYRIHRIDKKAHKALADDGTVALEMSC
jgi:hypothetical protein